MKTEIKSNLNQEQLTSILYGFVSHFIDTNIPESKLPLPVKSHIPIIKIYLQSYLLLKGRKFVRKFNMEKFFNELMKKNTLEEKIEFLEEFPALISQLVEFDIFEVLNFMSEEKASKEIG